MPYVLSGSTVKAKLFWQKRKKRGCCWAGYEERLAVHLSFHVAERQLCICMHAFCVSFGHGPTSTEPNFTLNIITFATSINDVAIAIILVRYGINHTASYHVIAIGVLANSPACCCQLKKQMLLASFDQCSAAKHEIKMLL